MIRIERIGKRYGDFAAVRDVSFEVKAGQIAGFLGVNGAGKTTTLRMLAGILRPSAGTASINGFDIQTDPIEAKRSTGFIPDRPYLYPKLTAFEYLCYVGELYQIATPSIAKRALELLEMFNLSKWKDQLIESFSHGMKQRVATCGALMHKPKALIVDEPMVGLDPHGAKLLKTVLREYAAAGNAVLLSTHSLNVAEEVTDTINIIQHGAIIASGTVQEIKALSQGPEAKLEQVFLELTNPGEEA
jgi:ABC-2 type transport system ATP-binding protein